MKKILFRLVSVIVALSFLTVPYVSADGTDGGAHLKILLIGNSFSEDASDGYTDGDSLYTGYSTLYNMIKTAVGTDVDVEIGLLASGGKTMTWHCWAAATEAHEYSFRVIGDSTGGSWTLGEGIDTSKGALEYDDWDVVVLQPYWLEVQVGYSTGTTTETRPWKNLEDSVPYMLDYAASFCPDAKFYLFFPWVMTQKLEVDADIKTYDKVRGFISLAENYTGTETGKGFDGVIPIGTAIQNARSTYMALQQYVNPDSPDPERVYFESDPVVGLQRDGAHVTYSVGRYIAALTFCRTVVPEEMTVGDPTDVEIRRAPGSPAHPEEYKELAAAAVDAALTAAKVEGSGRFARTALGDHKKDPTDSLVAKLQAEKVSFTWSADGGVPLEDAAKAAIEARLPEIAKVTVLSVEREEGSALAEVRASLLYGYTEREFDLTVTVNKPDVHEHEYSPTVTPPTCVDGGYTTYTCACGDTVVGDPTDPLGHDWNEGVMKAPASTVYEGKTLYTCLRCGETREEIIPKRDEVPKNERLRILFIGNSYSEDLTDGFTYPDGTSYTGYSTLYEMLRTVTGGEIEIEIGLLMSGGKSLTWHASVANNGYDYYAFRVVGDSTGGRWVELSQNATTVDGLNFYNWDMVVLQPYGNEVKKGETNSPNAQMKPFAKLEDSVPFMLDFVETRNPGAEIWLYLPIANIRKAEMNGGESDFGKTVFWVETASFMSGRETHKQFSGVIPIGTAIQNARSTYMAVQEYVYPGAPDPTVVNFDSDPIMGLQRDDLHVSYSVGRYIDALTFCKTAVPLNMKKPGAEPETVAIRRPEGAPALPEEYKELARAASDAAAESVDNKYVPIRMTGFEIDPTDTLMEKLASADLEAFCPDPSAAGTEDAVYNAIAATLPDNAVLTVDGLTVDGATATATVTVLYGYTARTAELTVTLLDHGHEYELASSDYAHDGREEYTEVYVCRICGKEDVRVIGKTPCPGLVFTDMPKVGNWAHDGIDFCLENGLMNGMTQNTFVPAGDMTRAMLVTVLWRAEGEPEAQGKTPFTDVKAKWAKDAVAWAYENEIVKGMTATTFAPDDKLSREQIATILYRYTEHKGGDTGARAELDRFPDGAKTHSYAKDAVSWAVAEGLISGTKAGDRVLLDPRGSATRAQVATILMRYLGAGTSPEDRNPGEGCKDVLVVVFSATGTTRGVAEKIAAITGADLKEIVPAEPYSSSDLDYNDPDSRSTREQNDPDARPALAEDVSIDGYGTVYLGYPIWWGQAPRIMSTFAESHDFSGVTVIPFCTSGSSDIGQSDDTLAGQAGTGTWLQGKRFSGSVTEDQLREWINETEGTAVKETLRLQINDTEVAVQWENNGSVSALTELASSGPLTVVTSEYGGFERVGSLGERLPDNDVRITTEPGDVVLYSGDQIVIFYGSNTWEYTRLGKITGLNADELAGLLSGQDVTVTLSCR